MGDRSATEARAEAVGFDDFYAREYPAIVALAFALSGSRWGAEDLAQEAFVALYRNWERVRLYQQPSAWVRHIVSNLSVSAYRRRVVELKGLARMALHRPSAVFELPEESSEFWRAVRSLPRRQEQVIALYYVEDLPVAEIAAILGTAEGTVKKHLHDGRGELARRLQIREEGA